jgi:hypothetical protein
MLSARFHSWPIGEDSYRLRMGPVAGVLRLSSGVLAARVGFRAPVVRVLPPAPTKSYQAEVLEENSSAWTPNALK